MEWFRWFNGTSIDPKMKLIAKRSKQKLPAVIAVWAMLLERASESEERGKITGFDCETIDVYLGLRDGATRAIMDAMEAKEMIAGDVICKWPERQVRKEDETATERKRLQREREKLEKERLALEAKYEALEKKMKELQGVSKEEASIKQDVTECHATSHDVTLDKIRRDKKENTYSASGDAVHVCVSSPKDSEKEAIPELKAVPSTSARPEPSQKKPDDSDTGERYRTKKGRFLTGKRLKAFNAFWNDFALPKGKAEAADAWLDIPDMTPRLVEQIRLAARQEAIHREEESAKGKSPKWAQGWLSGRRWEDEVPEGNNVPMGVPTMTLPVKIMSPEEVVKNQKAALERLKGEGRIASIVKKPVSPDFCQVLGGAQCS